MTIAKDILKKLNFTDSSNGAYENESDNYDLHDLLNDECNLFQTLCDQDVWSFGDGSYITRNGDDYFDGDDVLDFELIDEEQKTTLLTNTSGV